MNKLIALVILLSSLTTVGITYGQTVNDSLASILQISETKDLQIITLQDDINLAETEKAVARAQLLTDLIETQLLLNQVIQQLS